MFSCEFFEDIKNTFFKNIFLQNTPVVLLLNLNVQGTISCF